MEALETDQLLMKGQVGLETYDYYKLRLTVKLIYRKGFIKPYLRLEQLHMWEQLLELYISQMVPEKHVR